MRLLPIVVESDVTHLTGLMPRVFDLCVAYRVSDDKLMVTYGNRLTNIPETVTDAIY